MFPSLKRVNQNERQNMQVKLINGSQIPKLDSHERRMVRTVSNLLSLHMAVSPQGPEVSTADPRHKAKAVLDGLLVEDVTDPDGKRE